MKRRDTNVADMVVYGFGFDAFNLDYGPRQRDILGLNHVFAQNRDRYLGVFRTAQFFDGFHDGHILGGFAVNFDDRIAGFHTRLEGRRIFNGRHNRQNILQNGNFNADAAEAPLGFHFQFLIQLRRHKRAVGIERFNHSVDGALHQRRRIHFVDIVFLHHIQNFIKCFDFLIDVLVSCGNPVVVIHADHGKDHQ